jgi:ATP-dependent Clp protease ATP-binding subunit ClpC
MVPGPAGLITGDQPVRRTRVGGLSCNSGRSGDKGEGRRRNMFERFTDRARRVVVQAQEEARRLDHHYIGTEHILLALTHESIGGVAAKALESLGIGLETVRQKVEEAIGRGQPPPPSGHIPFTPRSKKVLELALSESRALGHNYIGTEHILLGLIREGDGVAAQVLVDLGADLNRVHQQVIQLLDDYRARH